MESGERLPSSTASSTAPTSSSTPSVASAISKGGLSSGVSSLSSAITPCGHIFRAAGDQPFNLSTVSSAFPMVSHPVFGLHSASSGHSEFGGLGTLGTPTALAAHPQLASFPGAEWWRTTDVHTRTGAPFFPPLLGIPPLFAPPAQNHDSSSFPSRTSGKSNRTVPEKGVNGSVNGNSTSSVIGVNTSLLSTTASDSMGQTKSTSSGGGNRKCNQEQSKSQSLDSRADKIKDKKPRKKAMESSSNSDSDSGTSSDTSTEGISSSDSDDLEEDEEEEDQSIEESEDDDSDSESEAQHKSNNQVLLHGISDPKADGQKATEKTQEKRIHQPLPLVSESQTHSSFQSQQKQPQVLSQQLPFIFQSSQAKEESVNKHTSVIQSTGLVSNVKPLSLVNQAKKEPYMKLIVPSPDVLKAGNKNTSEESSSLANELRSKREQYKQAFPSQLKKQESSKSLKKVIAALSNPKTTSSSPAHPKQPVENNHPNPFLTNALLGNHQPNGVIQSVIQEAPLALTTKTKIQSKINENVMTTSSTPFSSPVNLSTSGRRTPGSQISVLPSASPILHSQGKEKAVSSNVNTLKTQHHSHPAQSLVEQFRGTDSDIPSSKDSEDSNEDEEEDDEEDEDDEDDESDDSQSESDSNSESDTEGSEEEDDDDKDQDESDSDTEGEKTSIKLNKTTSSVKSPSISLTAHSTPRNIHIGKAPGSAPAALCSESQSPAFLGTSSSTLSSSPHSGTSKRRRVTDERELRIPLEYGWQRETRIRNFGGRLQGEVAYYAPCGKKLRQYPEVIKGMQWCLLKEEDVIPRIRAMEGRRGRPPNPDRQRARDESRMKRRKGRPPNVGNAEFLDNTDAKLLRKLQAQEIARQAAQIKLLRKLQKQEQARVAKEAKKQQAIMAAEEKRKQKEQIKIMKQQEKIKRIQQIRMEKELRAQQILEAKKKKKEEAANAKLLEAEKRIKEKEMRRQQAVLLKHQELERHRLDMERERRRQHMMLMKAMEARKKAEEKERLKQEKRDEKRLNKERKLEQRRLELEMAKELKKPNEDMCLADQKPLPALPRIPGLVLSGSTFSDCLMVVQFLQNFGKVLGFDVNVDVPNLSVLQEGLLNIGDSMGEVQDLLVRLLSAAVCDPGLITGYKAKTALGEHLLNVGVNRDNVSEILQIFMEVHCGQTELTESLKTKAFQAHTPAQKASILAFLINELACSKSVVSEIDKNIDYMSNLRRDKWVVEGKLRKLRIIHAKKTGKRDSSGGLDLGEEQHPLGTPTPGRKRRRKGGDSDYDDDDDDDSDDQADEDEEEEDDKEDKKGKKTDICEDEDEGDQAASVEELEKQIEKLSKQQSQYRRKLFDASHSLRSMMFGQDRYRRRYWILPQCGGIFVEGMESGEGLEEIAKEREKLKKAESIQSKEEMFETSGDPLNCSNMDHYEQKEDHKEKDNTNLFLQKPGSFSKLSKLLEVAKMSPESDVLTPKPNISANGCTLSYQNSGKHSLGSIPSATTQNNMEKTDSNLFNTGSNVPGKFYSPLPSDQLLKTLTEKNRQWFSLLPRTPCDDTSITHADVSTASLVTPQSQPPSKSPSPAPAPLLGSSSSQNPVGLSPFALSSLQMKSGVSMMGLQFCGWPTGVLTSNIPFTSPLPSLGSGLGLSEGNGNSFLTSNVASIKSESPVPTNEKVSSTQPAPVEVAKPVDFPSPKPIPEEMQFGWWRIIDPEDLKTLLKVLHLRGIREKALQKQIQKHLDYITQACIKNKDVAIIELNENEEHQVTRDIVENWSVEEQAMEMDLSILQQVEDLERRVASASLQVKGWMCPEPASERKDLVYFEHKSFTKLCKEHDGELTGEEENSAHALERKSDNPLDIAVTRLADLERNIERRYLKSPLSTTIQIKLDNVGTVTVPAPAPSVSGDGDGIEEDIAPGLRVWRRALSEARSAAQVALCIQQLQKSIAWEKSIMKVYCQICRKGDNEELLLLCDGCDKGCHTYCHRPKITTIPDGDWFCPACIAKASGQTIKIKKLHVKSKKTNESKKGKKVTLTGDTEDEDSASTSSSLKRGNKDLKKRKMEENTSINISKQESFTSVKKPKRDDSKDLTLCSLILTEMETHEDAWPFLLPVNLKLVPGYKKVIKKPMDFSTIREKLSNGQYPNLETFAVDVRLVFDNCETFNEDDSDIGRAGHSMRKYFEKKWTDTFKVS
ncbi:bromodomain adjacent to zinc finger domain protein 2B isoform X1 [Fukomys damarensis]|uniref:bromodomain adjacent to zinc finger domain protein 2B isoform X1 n=1 Tax=Fukomys damarensis TaxID=885580 RepID=UPI00054008D1|nr:bromodomain adjacent to zinc finger domain protein 2B isoform X1 [Fukomys damarensis]XP_010605097.1 bromodomain adjacent to zinc finger domain protein 2B isoform X1 [Fukomys damarensis]XP_010605098.1 bromodomain adjacent to zinc finger domain protein 2B isoform X1 [Fukomys damarensis]XP_010605100.1 bromodomain adjacent to zinc finger domain protein 2B isoform X1 [Fukomys damarensis]XP_010605101.1 bromodomain adjacent to zinc finger domain protein 2B isoform X1 [Fukomys damarensis]XP_0106051